MTVHTTSLRRDIGSATLDSVLVHTDREDPFAPPDDVVALGRSFSGHGVDWRLYAFGNTLHPFMASETASRRAWTSAEHLVDERFGTTPNSAAPQL